MDTRLLTVPLLSLALSAQTAVVDRVAVVVGKTVFTQSEVDDEARLAGMESGKPLDLSAASRKAAAERLVDRELLRQEMTATGFRIPSADSGTLIDGYRKSHNVGPTQLQAELTRYGLTQQALVDRLNWELSLIRFTDQRFKSFAPPADNNTANRVDNAPQQPAPETTDQQMDAWLKQRRADTRVVFVPEAFK